MDAELRQKLKDIDLLPHEMQAVAVVFIARDEGFDIGSTRHRGGARVTHADARCPSSRRIPSAVAVQEKESRASAMKE